ncbi:MAG: hypothetical protein Ct9H300mP31_00160 [Acidimicrobiaceae bacterium]|nr:MAG: hypothetical protein Ct9H300mP31_00160 [Acidimicrobiaceae bacterium]
MSDQPSRGLSHYGSSELAAREVDGDVRVVDSRSVTAGLGVMVQTAAQAAARGHRPTR